MGRKSRGKKQKQSRLEKQPLPAFSFKQFLREDWGVFVFLGLLVFVVYANSLNNAFVSDDIAGMARLQTENPTLGETLSQRLWLHALPIWLIYKIFGLNPFFFRLINLFFHLGTVGVFYLIIRELLSNWNKLNSNAKASAKMIAALGAAIFAVHPLLTESVVWISASAYPQYTFFALLALLFYMLSQQPTAQFKWYTAALISFLAALFSSEKAIFLPAIFLLYEISLGDLKKYWKRLGSFFIVGSGLVIYYFTQISSRITQLTVQNYTEPGTESLLFKIPIAITKYLELYFWPRYLTLYHSELSMGQGEFAVRVLVLIGLLGLAGLAYKKNRFFFFWLSAFVISLVPTLTPWRISWVVAERYAYFGVLGLAAVTAYLFCKLYQKAKWKRPAAVLIILLIFLLAVRTFVRNNDWDNADKLWIATGKTSPSDPKTHNNLGDVYGRRGNLEKSAQEFKKAIELKPDYADAYHNLANTYRQMGRVEEAIQNYQQAARLNPHLWQSYQNLAAIYFDQKDFELALQNMQKAIAVSPQDANLYINLAVIQLKLEQAGAAKKSLLRALELDPENQRAQQLWSNLSYSF